MKNGEAYKGEFYNYLSAFYNDELSTPMLLEVLGTAVDGWNKMNGTCLDRHDAVLEYLKVKAAQPSLHHR